MSGESICNFLIHAYSRPQNQDNSLSYNLSWKRFINEERERKIFTSAEKAKVALAVITRSVVYKKRQQEAIDEDEYLLLQLLDEEYTRLRSMVHGAWPSTCVDWSEWLTPNGYSDWCKSWAWQAWHLVPQHQQAASFAQTLSVFIERRWDHCPQPGVEYRQNRVWLRHGFVYLVAIIDWFSRKVLARRQYSTQI